MTVRFTGGKDPKIISLSDLLRQSYDGEELGMEYLSPAETILSILGPKWYYREVRQRRGSLLLVLLHSVFMTGSGADASMWTLTIFSTH